MSRAKASSSSFLDELLGTDTPAGDTRRKSVRFIDNDDDDILGSLLPSRATTGSAAAARKTTGTERSALDWLDSDSASKKPSQPTKGKADWLGLANDADDQADNKGASQPAATKSGADDDWLASSARRGRVDRDQAEDQRATTESRPSTSRHYSWLDTKRQSVGDSQSHPDESAVSAKVASREPPVAESYGEFSKLNVPPSAPAATSSVHAPFPSSFTSDSSLLLAQTQVT